MQREGFDKIVWRKWKWRGEGFDKKVWRKWKWRGEGFDKRIWEGKYGKGREHVGGRGLA